MFSLSCLSMKFVFVILVLFVSKSTDCDFTDQRHSELHLGSKTALLDIESLSWIQNKSNIRNGSLNNGNHVANGHI